MTYLESRFTYNVHCLTKLGLAFALLELFVFEIVASSENALHRKNNALQSSSLLHFSNSAFEKTTQIDIIKICSTKRSIAKLCFRFQFLFNGK